MDNGCRLEVVVNGLAAYNGIQIAGDATIVSPLRADCQAKPGAVSAFRAADGVTAVLHLALRPLSIVSKGYLPQFAYCLLRPGPADRAR